MNTVEELVKQKSIGSVYNLKIKQCRNSIFIYPVTEEEEVTSLTKSLKGKPTAGDDDDIPENLVKQRLQLIKGLLAHIYNLSLNSDVFQISGRQQK